MPVNLPTSAHFRSEQMRGEEVFTVKEVATLLKVGEKTVYSMAQTGELPAFKVRGQWRFSRKDIDAWIEQQKHTTQDFGESDQK
jgi:excisionase family DNA binding protein